MSKEEKEPTDALTATFYACLSRKGIERMEKIGELLSVIKHPRYIREVKLPLEAILQLREIWEEAYRTARTYEKARLRGAPILFADALAIGDKILDLLIPAMPTKVIVRAKKREEKPPMDLAKLVAEVQEGG